MKWRGYVPRESGQLLGKKAPASITAARVEERTHLRIIGISFFQWHYTCALGRRLQTQQKTHTRACEFPTLVSRGYYPGVRNLMWRYLCYCKSETQGLPGIRGEVRPQLLKFSLEEISNEIAFVIHACRVCGIAHRHTGC